jgi:hypothetical protein
MVPMKAAAAARRGWDEAGGFMGRDSFGYFSGRRETANPRRSDGVGLGMIFRSGTMISQFSISYSKYYANL